MPLKTAGNHFCGLKLHNPIDLGVRSPVKVVRNSVKVVRNFDEVEGNFGEVAPSRIEVGRNFDGVGGNFGRVGRNLVKVIGNFGKVTDAGGKVARSHGKVGGNLGRGKVSRLNPKTEAGLGPSSGTGILPVELRLRPHGRFFPGPARETTGKMPVPLPSAVSISEFGFNWQRGRRQHPAATGRRSYPLASFGPDAEIELPQKNAKDTKG
jgi:hypothetical protein